MPLLKTTSFLGFILFFFTHVHAQNTPTWDIQAQVQGYPTGIISGLRLQRNMSASDLLGIRLGHNLVRHRDLGEHEDERGGGFGGSLEYTRYLKPGLTQWHASLRTDLWRNKLDWEDNINQASFRQGKTDVWVLQPTLEIGYTFLKKNRLIFKPSIAFGREFNIKTSGEDVGQDFILLAGVSIGWRQQKN